MLKKSSLIGLLSFFIIIILIANGMADCNIPGRPGSISYPSEDGDGIFIITWSNERYATSYTLQKATNSAFNNAKTIYSGPLTSYKENTNKDGNYYYRVRSNNSCGISLWTKGGACLVGEAVSRRPEKSGAIISIITNCLLTHAKPLNIAVIPDRNEKVGLIIANKTGEKILVNGDKDNNGKLTKVTSVLYGKGANQSLAFWLGSNGLPEYIVSGDWAFKMSYHSSNAVNIAAVSPSGEISRKLDVLVNPEALKKSSNYSSTLMSSSVDNKIEAESFNDINLNDNSDSDSGDSLWALELAQFVGVVGEWACCIVHMFEKKIDIECCGKGILSTFAEEYDSQPLEELISFVELIQCAVGEPLACINKVIGQIEEYFDAFELYEEYLSYARDVLLPRLQVVCGYQHTLGLTWDHEVIWAGNQVSHANGWTDIKQLAASLVASIGLKSDGSVIVGADCERYKEFGFCKTDGWKNIKQVETGGYHTLGLREDGKVEVAGCENPDYDFGQCNVKNWTNIKQIAAGRHHTVGLKNDGTVVVAGCLPNSFDSYVDYGQCDSLNTWSEIEQIDAGSYTTVGLKKDGTVVAVGNQYFGAPDVNDWEDIVQIAAGSFHILGLKRSGRVVAAGCKANNYKQCEVEPHVGQNDWRDIIQVAAGGVHSIGLKDDGTLSVAGCSGTSYTGACNVRNWDLWEKSEK